MQRRTLMASGAAAALPRFAIGQGDGRPTLTVAVQKLSNSNTLEPLSEQSNPGYRASPLYAEGLIAPDWTGGLVPVPGLATGWRRVDERTVEFDLRPGVRFHNGDVLTAEDVVFSFGRRMSGGRQPAEGPGRDAARKDPPAEAVATARLAYPGLERVDVVREGVVRLVTSAPDPTLEGRIQQNIGVILSRRGFDDVPTWLAWARAPVGSGPYRVAEFRPDVSMTLEAHDTYWGGRPPARAIRMVEVPEVASRINALLSGEADFVCDLPPDQIAAVERNPRFEVVGSTINNIRVMTFDKSHPQLADARVRRAMTLAIDQRAIIEAIWAGRTKLPKGLQLEAYGEMFLRDWDVPRHDPGEARRLLREAGYRGAPIPYRLINNYYTNQFAGAQVMVEMWRAVGLNVVIEMRENWSQVYDGSTPRGINDDSSTALFNDPVSQIVRTFGPRSSFQRLGYWSHEEFNRLSGELETAASLDRRRATFRRMLDIAEREDPAYVVLHQAATFTAKRRDIAWRPSDAWALDFRGSNLTFPARR